MKCRPNIFLHSPLFLSLTVRCSALPSFSTISVTSEDMNTSPPMALMLPTRESAIIEPLPLSLHALWM